MRRPNAGAERKYAKALEALQSDKSLTIDAVAQRFDLNPSSFRSFVRTWHPSLLLGRSHMATAAKYADAIAAMREDPAIGLTEVAAAYGYSPDTFRGYLRRHAPELLEPAGIIADGAGHRCRRQSVARYDAAICFYNCTGGSLRGVAARYGLVYNSLYSYVRRNHPDLLYRNTVGKRVI